MSRIIALILLFAVVGLIAGYLLFAKMGNSYVKPTSLLRPADSALGRLGQKAVGIPKIRTNILIAGAVGAGVGLLLGAATGRRR